VETLAGLQSNGRLLTLPTNIRQGWKGLSMINTLTYYNTKFITAVKSFKVQATNGRLDTQHNDTKQNDTQHNSKNGTLSITTLSIMIRDVMQV